jgi:hypothetical protein
LRHAQEEVARIKALVESGTVAPARLKQAEEELADAEDQDTLAHTLYSSAPVANMTDAEAQSMKAAAQRRVDRQQKMWESRRELLESGVLAQAELEETTAELEHRKQVLQLVDTRLELLNQLKRMAETERQAELRAQSGTLAASLIRYEGSGSFSIRDLASLSARFQKKFGYALPVSAVGQTNVHTALGLDHHNRADIALNPESKEGLWFRQLLEQLHVPYLAFRSAVAGAATAPHIHLGTGSTRLKIAGASE